MALLDIDFDGRPPKWREPTYGRGLRPNLTRKPINKSKLRQLLDADRANRQPAPVSLPKLSILKDDQ